LRVVKERCSRGCGSVINALEAVASEGVVAPEGVVAQSPVAEEAEREEDLQFHHRSETNSGRWVHIKKEDV
jgi:hypothetical protein